MKRIWYELFLDYENEIEKMLPMLDMDSIRRALESEGKSFINRAYPYIFRRH